MKRLFSILLLLIAVSSLSFAENKPSAQAKVADKLALTTITGKKLNIIATAEGLNIDAYKGKVVILEFWGTGCPPCRASIPHYINIIKKYGKNVAMLAVEAQQTPKNQLISFVKSKGINYDVVTTDEGNQFLNYVGARTGWGGQIPFLILINKKGKVVATHLGWISEDRIVKSIKKLINQK